MAKHSAAKRLIRLGFEEGFLRGFISGMGVSLLFAFVVIWLAKGSP